jgi:hypothetical protein
MDAILSARVVPRLLENLRGPLASAQDSVAPVGLSVLVGEELRERVDALHRIRPD